MTAVVIIIIIMVIIIILIIEIDAGAKTSLGGGVASSMRLATGIVATSETQLRSQNCTDKRNSIRGNSFIVVVDFEI